MTSSSKKVLALLVLTLLWLTGGYFYYQGTMGDSPSETIAYVDVRKVFTTSSYYQEQKKRWLRNRKRLRNRYGTRIRPLLETLREKYDVPIPLASSSSGGNRKESAGDTALASLVKSNQLPETTEIQLQTLSSRKKRVEAVIESSRRKLVQRGHQRIRQSVSTISDERGFEVVLEKPAVLHHTASSDTVSLSQYFPNITQDVKEHINSARQP